MIILSCGTFTDSFSELQTAWSCEHSKYNNLLASIGVPKSTDFHDKSANTGQSIQRVWFYSIRIWSVSVKHCCDISLLPISRIIQLLSSISIQFPFLPVSIPKSTFTAAMAQPPLVLETSFSHRFRICLCILKSFCNVRTHLSSCMLWKL